MAGEDETRARAALVGMQGKISQGPNVALGVMPGATPEHVRTAFLALTKVFHPARFGRMSPEIQKLSNEVFLGIKSAHETLMKALGVPLRSPSGTSPTGPHPVLPRGSSPPPTTLSAQTTQKVPALSRPVTPAFGVRIGARPATPPSAPAAAPPPDPAARTGPVTNPPTPDERLELQRALDLMTAKSWSEARQAMTALAARVPMSKQYRALLCYTRGREAQAAGKGEEAAMELQRALQLDPELSLAKSALADLLRRR